MSQHTPSSTALFIVAGLLAVATAGYVGISTGVAEDGPPEDPHATQEESETSPRDQSYEARVAELRELPDAPALTLEEAPSVGSTVEHDEQEWRKRLTEQEFHILREAGTERPGSGGELLHNKETGVYTCAGCGAPLFSSKDKFDSGTGWPSYTAPNEKGRVDYSKDDGMFGYRIEVHCARCGGHLGHVFADGPEPTGQRYCINAAALDFEAVSDDE